MKEQKPDFKNWCHEWAEKRMKEEYGPDWEETCPDDDAYNGYLFKAGYEYHRIYG